MADPLDTGAPAPPPFWQAIGLTFGTCVRNARACLILSVPFALFIGVTNAIGRSVSLNVDPTGFAQGELVAVSAAVIAAFGTLVLVGIFVLPPTIGALSLVGSAAIEGDRIDPTAVFRRTVERTLEVVGAGVLSLLIVAGPLVALSFIGGIVSVVATAEAAVAVVVFAFLVLLVPTLYAFVRLSLAIPVVMREGLGPIDALRRSWELVAHAWWWVFGVYVVVWLAAVIINGVVTSIGTASAGIGGFFLVAILSTVGAGVATSLVGVAAGVVYSGRALPHVVQPAAPGPQTPPGI